MTVSTSRLWPRLDRALPLLVLVLLASHTYAVFFQVPYAGFLYDGRSGEVLAGGGLALNILPQGAAIRPGDHLIQVGPVRWDDFRTHLRLTLFDGVRPGDLVPIVVARDGQRLSIPWTFPGPTGVEILERLYSQWFLAYIFWLVGTVTLLAVRPKDERWWLLIAFNYLTAFWLAVGGQLSRAHVWNGAIVLRTAIWLSVPVYLHLHWIFPRPLARLPRGLWAAAYLAGLALAAAQWFERLPRDLYLFGFLLMLGGSLALLIAHLLLQPSERRSLFVMGLVVSVAVLPPIAVGLVGAFGSLPPYSGAGALLALPGLPFAYLYAAYRRRLGGLELRTNRLISSYTFAILLGTGLTLLIAALNASLDVPGKSFVVAFGAAVLAAAITGLGLHRFQRFVEHRVLGMPLPPTHLLRTYSERITTCLELPALSRLLTDELLPTLLVRQSALVILNSGEPDRVLSLGVTPADLPAAADLPGLLADGGRYRPPDAGDPLPCPWVRLALPLTLGGQPVGVWLFGRRDPDDFYSQAETPTLQAIAHQTAIALANTLQAERLHALYQADIDRHEAERARLAHELHDDALAHLASLRMQVDEEHARPGFAESYQGAVESLRRAISGLRPAMLSFGLGAALQSLADDLLERSDDLEVSCELTGADRRYDSQLEQHVYRIVQQACENALRHAHARRLRIRGDLEPDRIDLTVEDDGVGFPAGKGLDLPALLAQRHFGLAGMFERAMLVGARLQINSAPGRGTRVHLLALEPAAQDRFPRSI